MLRLADRIEATHVGVEMDPSHLMWQGIDPVRAIDALGDLVYVAAAKDIRLNDAALVNGVLDDGFDWIPEGSPGYLRWAAASRSADGPRILRGTSWP